jgi:ribosomal protein S18 acetylase RimI-like enzyme
VACFTEHAVTVVSYRSEHFAGVEALWATCFPDDLPRNRAAAAIPAKLALGDGLLFVAEGPAGEVHGTVMAGYDGHRGWLYAVAVDPELRKRGVGRALVDHACAELAARGCGKVNLQVRDGNETAASFYASLGFDREPRISFGRVLSSD